MERISSVTDKVKTEYIYDGRGSVAAEVSYNSAWYTLSGAIAKKNVTTKAYTPFGEQIGEAVSGFGYKGEYYSAATGQVYLRARFYTSEIGRFSQKDILRGSTMNPQSLNRYTYCLNDPVNFADPSGMKAVTVPTDSGGGPVYESASVHPDNSRSSKSTPSTSLPTVQSPVPESESCGEAIDWGMVAMLGGSTLEILFGVGLIATGAGGPAGAILLAGGVSSLIGGVLSENNGGSFFSGWLGGEISGLLAGYGLYGSGVAYAEFAATGSLEALNTALTKPFVFGFAGNTASNALTGLIDNGELSMNELFDGSVESGMLLSSFGPLGYATGETAELYPVLGSIMSLIHEGVTDTVSFLANS